MVSDLKYLFLGSRYIAIDRSTRLRRNHSTVTDIDAAVVDLMTGELALFQLKWQDFSTNDVIKQRSKAKNFVDQVDAWARNVQGWINEFGIETLGKALQLRAEVYEDLTAIRLFAIGRTASRFQSYGYSHDFTDVAACSWPQFVRCRYQVGPSADVFLSRYLKIQSEQTRSIKKEPIPHEIIAGGHRVFFQDLWNVYDEHQ
jgi:hypothetical protein